MPTVMPWKIIGGRDVDGPGNLGVLVRSSSTVANCPVRAIWRRTAPACVITPWPQHPGMAGIGASRVARIRAVVVLPAP